MFPQSSSVARRSQQCLSLLWRLNTCTGPGKIGSFSSENLQKSTLFSSKNRWGFSGNEVLSRALVHFHLQTGFRNFSANPLQPCESQDDEFSEVDVKETKEAEVSEVRGSSQSKTIDLLFKEAIGLDKISETKRLALEVEGLSDLPPEEQVEKLKSKLESQCEIIDRLRQNIDDLEMKIKELIRNYGSLVKTSNWKVQRVLKSNKRSKDEIDNNTEEVPSLASIFSTVNKNQKQKKMKIHKKAEGVSGCLEHPWPEWVQFLEHLNERGYLSKALNFPGGTVDLRGFTTDRIHPFIKFAAVNFAKDHPEISTLLSGSDVRKVVLYDCPSVEFKVVLAAKRLRFYFSTEDTVGVSTNLENTNNAPSAEVSKIKSLELEDLVRLLCAFGLNAEKGEISISDEIKQSVVKLLKELINFSASSVNDGECLSLRK